MPGLAFLALCIGALLAPLGAAAQWQQTGGPEGGVFRAMAATRDGIVGVLGANGLFRYQAGSWTRVSDFTPSQIISVGETLIGTAPGTASLIEYYRSDDAGVTWETVGLQTDFNPVVSVVGESVYAVRNDTLFVSTDGLKSMQALTPVPQFTQPPIGRTDLLIAGVGFFSDSIYRSIDGGRTWTPILAELPQGGSGGRILTGGGETFYMLTANTNVYRSSNGEVWEPLGEGLPAESRIDWIVANDEAAFVHVNSGSLYHLDGDVWKAVEVPGYPSTPALDGDRLLIPTNTGAYAYTVEGNSLISLSTGLRNVPISAVATTGSAVFAGGANGIYRSLDEGESWDVVNNSYVWSFESHGETIFAVANGDIIRSTDQGTTWASMQAKFDDVKNARWGTTEFALPFTSISIADDGTLYVTVAQTFGEHGVTAAWRDGGVFRSNDNGETWAEVSAGLPDDGFTVVPVNDAVALDDGVVLISTLDGIYRSTSRGTGWRRASAGLPTDDVARTTGTFFVLNGHVYLHNSAGLYRSDMTAGESWQPASNPPVEDQYWTTYGDHSNIVDGKLYVYLPTWNGVSLDQHVYSFDGTVWEDVTSLMPEGVTLQAFAQKGDRIFAGAQWHSVWSKNLVPSSVNDPVQAVAEVSISPNPSAGEVVVRLDLKQEATVGRISVTNVLGETISVLHEGRMSVGENEYRFDAGRLPAGAYIVQITVDGKETESLLIRQ